MFYDIYHRTVTFQSLAARLVLSPSSSGFSQGRPSRCIHSCPIPLVLLFSVPSSYLIIIFCPILFVPFCHILTCLVPCHPVLSCSVPSLFVPPRSVLLHPVPSYAFPSQAIPTRYVRLVLFSSNYSLPPCPYFSIDSRSILLCCFLFLPSTYERPYSPPPLTCWYSGPP